jgi:hypothetical protein
MGEGELGRTVGELRDRRELSVDQSFLGWLEVWEMVLRKYVRLEAAMILAT